jgi:hypothetical protein
MNLIATTTVNGKTSVQSVTTSPIAIVTNDLASGKTIKINALYISNVDGTNAADITVDFYRNSTAYHILSTVGIVADATLDVISKSIYLEEGDSLRLTASVTGDLQAVCSYEELS